MQTMLVMDNFFENPMEVREQALKLTYPPTHEDDQYGGQTFLEVMLPPNSDDVFEKVIKKKVRIIAAGIACKRFQ